MAANDQIVCVAQVLRHTRSHAEHVVQGPIDYTILDETDPKNVAYINGGTPTGAGFPYKSKSTRARFMSGEYVIVQLKNRNASDKILDSTGSTSGKILLGIRRLDKNTREVIPDVLTETDRSTDLFADDPTMTSGKWRNAYAFKVPEGEEWVLWGAFQADFRTTA